ncbi:hypothetical protein EVAR_58228_1 [Eumeta japonica]|uniref:Uncharacterized protein n=1 Tax=Eumeta variegata TaxID=151549 RepID=A0A4C2AEU2_EUMVA|nr:hypothetical protein EVAR_58228_1 [Eumeta japonica]
MKYGIDIALIQETFLKPNRPRACAIAGYVQLERTGLTLERCTALYYSRSLHCCPITFLHWLIWKLRDVDSMTGHRTIVIVSVYLRLQSRSDLRALALGMPSSSSAILIVKIPDGAVP